MSKNMYQITLDYNRAKVQANKLDVIASDIAKEKRQLENCRNNLLVAWKGDSANAYANVMSSVIYDLEKRENNVRKIASSIRTMAKNTYEAEKTAIQKAESRKYNK